MIERACLQPQKKDVRVLHRNAKMPEKTKEATHSKSTKLDEAEHPNQSLKSKPAVAKSVRIPVR